MPFETIFKHAVNDKSLPLIYRVAVYLIPKLSFKQDFAQSYLCTRNSMSKAIQKPFEPTGDFRRAALLFFELFVIIFPFWFNLGGEAIESIWDTVRSCQCHIRYGSGNAAIAIIEWVDGDKP